VLLLDEPTRGIDVGAKADIFELHHAADEAGPRVLFATSELEEALHVPDRLLVMSKGRIVRGRSPRSGDEGGDHGGIGRDHPARGGSPVSTARRLP
jgi:erythritol transport system ATP-binding protein